MKYKEKLDTAKIKILLIGTLPPPVGGASILLKHLIDSLEIRNDVETFVINTGCIRWQGLRGLIRLWHVLIELIKKIRLVDIVTIHVAPTGLPLIGPIVCVLTKLWRKPLLVRKFGGTDYTEFGRIKFNLARWVVRNSKCYLVETKDLVQRAQNRGVANVNWYPNNRPINKQSTKLPEASNECRRFVFLSQVKIAKGIPQIIEAAQRITEDVTIDIYGPFFDGLSEETFSNLSNINYCGVVDPEEVPKVLSQYDALLLPTYYPGEGYPGIILEAYVAGLPVITTRWKSIPEIVDESCGFLIGPRNTEELYCAMKKVMKDGRFYARLCEGAFQKRVFFDSQVWADYFVKTCLSIIKG